MDDSPGFDELTDRFRAVFPDGIVYDTDSLAGAQPMCDLDPALLAVILPSLLADQDSGHDLVPVAGRWLTPVYRSGELVLIFDLPPESEPERVRNWLNELAVWSFRG